MYGKSYESKYDGSLMGSGINVFAVWDWICTKARAGYIEVNPELLAFVLGGKEQDVKEIEDALEFLQRPDPKSRSKLEGGRRLVKEGEFQYRLVNWEAYNKIKTEEDRREYNRVKQAERRAMLNAMTPEERAAYEAGKNGERKRPRKSAIKAAPGSLTYEKLAESGASDKTLSDLVESHLPEKEGKRASVPPGKPSLERYAVVPKEGGK